MTVDGGTSRMTIKIKWLDRIAIKEPGKPWVSDNKTFAEGLNITATPENVRNYVPNMEEALIDLAKEHYKGLEVLQGPEPLSEEERKKPDYKVY